MKENKLQPFENMLLKIFGRITKEMRNDVRELGGSSEIM
jgi:hypothetical protein